MKSVSFPVVGTKMTASYAYEAGYADAAQNLMEGDVFGAIATLGEESPMESAAQAMPLVGYAMAKKYAGLGSLTLIRLGPVRLTL